MSGTATDRHRTSRIIRIRLDMSQSRFPPVDEQLEHLMRGAVDLVEQEQLRAKLERSRRTGEPLVVKTGFDPSAPDLHFGHTVLLNKMRHFQDIGHTVIFVIGDFTGMIGDPTGKKATRPQLTREQLEANKETYESQVFHILDRDTTVVEYNSRWLDKLGADGMVKLAGKYTLARMMERDDFRTRFRDNQPISIHELLYPLAQGYDSVALEADVELGGTDQLFNLLVGRTLMREYGLEPQVILTTPLLVGLDGVEKMSKSLGNAVGLNESPREMFGKTMSIPDALMWDWYLLLTDVSENELAKSRERIDSGELHPKELKQKLAGLLTARFHDEDAAKAARREFENVFSRGGAPENIPTYSTGTDEALAKLLVRHDLVASNKDAHRLVKQGAVSIDGERVADPFSTLAARDEVYLLKVGKRRFARLRVEAD